MSKKRTQLRIKYLEREQTKTSRLFMSAVASLLVATIMLVSTTYAWITLSQAPEATGLQTNITGNGSLEIALMPADGRGVL